MLDVGKGNVIVPAGCLDFEERGNTGSIPHDPIRSLKAQAVRVRVPTDRSRDGSGMKQLGTLENNNLATPHRRASCQRHHLPVRIHKPSHSDDG